MLKLSMFLALLAFLVVVWPFVASYIMHRVMRSREFNALKKMLTSGPIVEGLKLIHTGETRASLMVKQAEGQEEGAVMKVEDAIKWLEKTVNAEAAKAEQTVATDVKKVETAL